jgi:dTDP-4-amino-4,6-dideoxygalactose transaminase
MFVSRHREVAEAVGRLRAFGVDRSHGERSLPGLYDVPTLGLNYRLGEMGAALGRVQLRRMGQVLDRRRANFEALRRGLSGVPHTRILDLAGEGVTNSHYCLSVVLEGPLAARRNELVTRINAAGVGTSVYYPHPVPRLTYYRNRYGYDAGRWPAAAAISDHSVALPVGPHLDPSDMEYVAAAVRQAVEES